MHKNPIKFNFPAIIESTFKKITNFLIEEKKYYMLSYTDKSGSFRFLDNLKLFIVKVKAHITTAKNISSDQIKDGSNDILVKLENKEEQIRRLLDNDIQILKSMICVNF